MSISLEVFIRQYIHLMDHFEVCHSAEMSDFISESEITPSGKHLEEFYILSEIYV